MSDKTDKSAFNEEREKIDVIERLAGEVAKSASPIARGVNVAPKFYARLISDLSAWLDGQAQYGRQLAKDDYIKRSLESTGTAPSRLRLLANIHRGHAALKDATKPMPAEATTFDGQLFASPVALLAAEKIGYTQVYKLYSQFWTTAAKGQGRKAPTLDVAAARTLQSRKDGLGPGRLWTPAANAAHFLALFDAMLGLPSARALWPPDDMLTVQHMLGEAYKHTDDAQADLDAQYAPPPITASQGVADQAEADRAAQTILARDEAADVLVGAAPGNGGTE